MDGETELSIMPFESRVNLATPSQPPDTINYTICDDANNDIAYAVSIIERGVVITPNGNGARKLIEVRPNLARRAEINILMLWCKMSEMINSKSLLIMTVSIARLIYLKIRGKSLQSLSQIQTLR